jgi:ribosomal protein S18 acetylase RimI-like enzyme
MPLIQALRPGDWIPALQLALARVPEAERPSRVHHCQQLLQNGVLDPEGIWVARSAKQIVGVQVCVPLPGAASLFWLPAGDDASVDLVVQAGLRWARKIGCKIAQAIANPAELIGAEPLIRNGFRPTTRMHQLAHGFNNLRDESLPALRYENYCSSLRPLFAATLERTYEATLDCPELNGIRTIDEILAGHQGQAKFHPQLWWLSFHDATPIGVVMLVELCDGAWELAYLGIVPEFRQRGFGRAMTLHALHALRNQAAVRLLLAVDARNTPALRLYEALGFVEIEANDVLLHFFGGSSG